MLLVTQSSAVQSFRIGTLLQKEENNEQYQKLEWTQNVNQDQVSSIISKKRLGDGVNGI